MAHLGCKIRKLQVGLDKGFARFLFILPGGLEAISVLSGCKRLIVMAVSSQLTREQLLMFWMTMCPCKHVFINRRMKGYSSLQFFK